MSSIYTCLYSNSHIRFQMVLCFYMSSPIRFSYTFITRFTKCNIIVILSLFVLLMELILRQRNKKTSTYRELCRHGDLQSAVTSQGFTESCNVAGIYRMVWRHNITYSDMLCNMIYVLVLHLASLDETPVLYN